MWNFKRAGVIGWLVGISALTCLAIWSGIDAIGQAIVGVGWGILLIVAARAATIAAAGAGWWLIFPPPAPVSLGTCVLLRFVRAAANDLLPLSQVGGDFISVRLMTFFGVAWPLAAGSIVADVLLQAVTQFLFAALGLMWLVALGTEQTITSAIAIGLIAGVLMLGGFCIAQQNLGRRFIHLGLRALTSRSGDFSEAIDSTYQCLARIYARRARLLVSAVVHMLGWLIGVAEILIFFSFIGHPVSLGEAVVIESLLHAVRGAAFVIPGAYGAQEGGLILLCGIFGIPPEQAIALSLVKRVAELALGIPGLVGLQVLELGRFVPRNS